MRSFLLGVLASSNCNLDIIRHHEPSFTDLLAGVRLLLLGSILINFLAYIFISLTTGNM